jgi:uncharacterized iron-regulated membrane protein
MTLFSDKNVYNLHKWFGLIGGLFMLMLSLTGVLLLYSEPLDRALNPALTQVTPAGQRLSVDSLLNIVKKQYPEAEIGNILLQTEAPDLAIVTEASVDKKRILVHQNPYTGLVLGSRERNQTLHRKILVIHEHLTIGDWGHFILFIVGVCLLGLVVTGLWYYRRSLLDVFKVGVRQRNTYLKNSDLHKLVGFCGFLFLLVMGGTGTFMHWEKVEKMFDDEQKRPESSAAITPTANAPLEMLIQKATASVPGFVPQQIVFARHAQQPTAVRGTRPQSNRLLGKFTTEVLFDAQSGEQQGIVHKEDQDLEVNLEASMEQIHFGQYGGWFVRLLYALGSSGLATMTITGFMIWWKKRK